ncbi:hypothetical protein [Streptomyces sp. NPDC005507]|uniref:hypothetical protein n=1 Tax=Streptomyces sp. NPDC005507 TaxID=3154885 RepID=UPI0033A9688F
MTTDVNNTTTTRRPETGWAKARRRRGNPLRTCVPARSDSNESRQSHASPDWNVVRGDD